MNVRPISYREPKRPSFPVIGDEGPVQGPIRSMRFGRVRYNFTHSPRVRHLNEKICSWPCFPSGPVYFGVEIVLSDRVEPLIDRSHGSNAVGLSERLNIV